MFHIFEKYLAERIIIAKEDLHLIQSLSVQKKVYKKEFLLKEGEVCKNIVFNCKGLLRLYKIENDGKEFILKFGLENNWMSDRESYITNKPSQFAIEAIEDSEVLIWEKEQFDFLLEEIPGFKNWMRSLNAKSQIANQKRIYTSIISNSAQKYFNFLETHPRVFNRVPLHMVAAYLGVSRETLSRIRKHVAYK